MLKIFPYVLPIFFCAFACNSGQQAGKPVSEEIPQKLSEENRKPDKIKPTSKVSDTPQLKGLTHTIDNHILKIFTKEDTTIMYKKTYKGDVINHSGHSSWNVDDLYHVYLELEAYEDLLVVCRQDQQGALLEFHIPDSVSMNYEDLHSGGIHSLSPSGNLLVMDLGTGSSRQLRIYNLKTNDEVGKVDYDTSFNPKWDQQDRLTFYDSGPAPDSVNTNNEAGMIFLYEQTWDKGQITLTGSYKKIMGE